MAAGNNSTFDGDCVTLSGTLTQRSFPTLQVSGTLVVMTHWLMVNVCGSAHPQESAWRHGCVMHLPGLALVIMVTKECLLTSGHHLRTDAIENAHTCTM